MNENFESKKIDSERSEEEITRLVKDVAHRNRFQRLAFEMLNVHNDPELALKYSTLIKNFIDDPENTEIRNLIAEENYNEAAQMMVEEIRKQEAPQKVA